MTQSEDAFVHHPELRNRISDPDTSFFRTFNVPDLLEQNPQLKELHWWLHTDEQREALRDEALAGHKGDLWVFGYGSLMWDPALHFTEVRRARLDGYARKFILVDDKGGRGTKEAPGLFAALDTGEHCQGLAFRIAEPDIDTETQILFRRELIGPGYLPRMLPIQIGSNAIPALVFVADHTSPEIHGTINREKQIQYLATGSGTLGTSYEYLEKLVEHFGYLDIEDAHCIDLLRAVDAYITANCNQELQK